MSKSYLKWISLYFLILLTGCTSDSVNIEKTVSQKFTEAEVDSAINYVIDNFSFPGAVLKRVVYDEDKSKKHVRDYLSYGRDSTNRVKADNVIVILTDFMTNHTNPVLNRNSMYRDFQFILFRQSKEKSE